MLESTLAEMPTRFRIAAGRMNGKMKVRLVPSVAEQNETLKHSLLSHIPSDTSAP